MPTSSIVFIDSRVANYQLFIDSLTQPYEVFVLDADKDGLDQIAGYLKGRSGLDAIHVVSHGSQGALYLGSTVLNSSNLARYETQLGSIGASLTLTGDILLYGCHVAQGEAGLQFVSQLARATGADVAASDDATGATAWGGDAVLERTQDVVEASGLALQALTRLLAANTAPTFTASRGVRTTDFGADDEGRSITLQADGKILVAGYSGGNFALARYNANGSLDTSFDTDGKLTTDFGSSDYGQSITLQADGKILVAGSSGNDLALARYNANGSLDTSFDTDGKLTTDFGSSDYGQSITLQADGKILVAGFIYSGRGDFALARYNTDGSLDTSFDTDGMLTTDFGSDDRGQSITLQADGKILVGGYSEGIALARYNANGSLDTSFSGDGKLTTDIIYSTAGGQNITLQADGKILVAGYSGGNFALARYNANGSLDTSFDGDGKALVSVGKNGPINEYAYAVSLQADGKIVLAGTTGNYPARDFALARLNPDGSPDTSFSPAENTLDHTPTYTEPSYWNNNPVVLDPDVQVMDTQLTTAGNYSGAKLTLARAGGATAQDVYSAKSGGTLSTLNSGDYFSVDSVSIGRVTTNAAGTLTLTFKSNATQSLVNKAMQQIAYANTSDAPPARVLINWTFNDGNTGAQGTGGALSITGSTTVTITPTNDAPVSAYLLQDLTVATDVPFTSSLPSGAFTDPDLETITYSVSMSNGSGTPPWLNINPTTGALSGTPDPLDVGVFSMRITARDSTGATASDDFQLTIATPSLVQNGTEGNDNLVTGGGNDVINALAGNDTLDGGAGNDNMLGGDGSDLYHVRDAGDSVNEANANASSGGTDTVYSYISAYTLTANVENGRLMASTAANLTGNALANLVYAGEGDNIIDGDAGTDTVSYAYATAGVTASLVSLIAQDTEGSGIDTLRNIENISGSKFDDTLTGNNAINVLNGDTGADVMMGRDGSDTYYVDNAGDVVTETNSLASTGGTDHVHSSLAAYTLSANVENGRIRLSTEANLTGNSLNNTLYAGVGNNVINGSTGTDTVSYAYGVTGTVGVTANLTTGVATGSGTDSLVGVEALTGSNNNDSLTGNTGANTLNGGSGNDTLSGGAGVDSLTGGLGADTFVYSAETDSGITSSTWDTITDFSSLQLDKINVAAMDANTGVTGDQAFMFIGSAAFTAAGQLRYDATAKVLYGSTDADTTAEFAIALTGVVSLVAADFVL